MNITGFVPDQMTADAYTAAVAELTQRYGYTPTDDPLAVDAGCTPPVDNNPITVQDMADAWRIHEQTILSAIHDGRLPAQQIGSGKRSQYLIQPEDAEAYAGQHRPRDKGDQAVRALIGLLVKHGLERVCRACHEPMTLMEEDGFGILINWEWQQIPGAVYFVRVVYAGEALQPTDPPQTIVTGEPRLMVVNALANERATWQAIADKGDAPTTVLMAPEGHIPKAGWSE